ncbi:ricin B-type lectin domain-containing protein [Favolaschia claudopus]|uniref:Ricin B-type lectin domain-containing protein n=1 Tax=Favolaschia claudopus TaxID=2862362 RepID=A0AAW0C323_9AGAR
MLLSALVGFAGVSLAVAQTVNLDASIFYNVAVTKGKVAGCSPLDNMLSNRGCDQTVQDLWNADDGSHNQRYRCQYYLSVQDCGGSTTTDLYTQDDGSGRQRWLLKPVSGVANTYNIIVAGGRAASCGTYLSTGSQCTDTFVDLFTSDDGSGRQQWTLTPIPVPAASLPLAPFKFNELPLGAVKPTDNSWLKNQLSMQANGLHGNLQNFWPNVQTSTWLGGNSDYSNLHEAGSYWLNGVVPTAFQLNDARLLGDVGKWVNYILAHQQSDGWLGPNSSPRVLWGTYPALLALRQYAQANTTAAPAIYNSLEKFFTLMNSMLQNGGNGLEEWGIVRWQDGSIVVQWMLDTHPNGHESMYLNILKLLRYGGANWKRYFTSANFPTAPLNRVDINAHGVNVGQAIKSEAVAYRLTHDTTDLDSTRTRISLIEQYHGRSSGVLGADEHLAGLMPSRGSELCTVVESMYSFEYVYSVLGDNQYADMVEKLAYNALPGTLSGDAWEHQYLQQANQIKAAHLDPSPFATDGPDSNIFGLAPNYPCCTVNHGQGWPKFIAHAYMTSSDSKTLYHALLSPTTFSANLANNNAVTVSAQTGYPFSSTIAYKTTAQQAFSFGIRVPSWVSNRQISYTVDGGASQTGTANSDGYVVLNVGSGSHTVTANIPMSIRTESRYNKAVTVYRGPLTYSLDVAFSTTVLNTYAMNAKDLQYTATSAWQYAISTANLTYNGDSSTAATAQSAFAPGAALVTISANVCPINWGTDLNSAAAPPNSPATCTGNRVAVKLVPYGNAKLRMTELPTF